MSQRLDPLNELARQLMQPRQEIRDIAVSADTNTQAGAVNAVQGVQILKELARERNKRRHESQDKSTKKLELIEKNAKAVEQCAKLMENIAADAHEQMVAATRVLAKLESRLDHLQETAARFL